MYRPLLSLSIIILTSLASRSFAQCNTVDALTSASFRITEGEACSTHINLDWNFRHNNGEMVLEWGPTNEYGNTINIYDNNPIRIPDLTPNTEYFIHTYGLYRNRTYDYYSFSVTTAAGSPTNNPPEITSAEAVSCTTGQTTTYTVTATDADDDAVTFTAEGLPDWVSFASPLLSLNPLSESTDAVINLIADDGNGGMDTLSLAITVNTGTSVLKRTLGHKNTFTLVSGERRISFSPAGSQPVTISLHNLRGSTLLSQQIQPMSGNSFTLPAGISAGMYLLRLSDNVNQRVFPLNVRK